MWQTSQPSPASEHRLRVIWPFVVIVVVLALVGMASVDMLAAARAFVGGESLWSNAQKEAVLQLLRYGQSGDETAFGAYLRAIAVPLGDRQARLELERADPDFEKVRAGLIAGGNHVDDIPGMIRMFRHFRHVAEIDQAVSVWAQADAEVMALEEQARRLHALIPGGACDANCVGPLLQQIGMIDARLTPLETAFSYALGKASRRVRELLLPGIAAVAALLLLPGILIANRTLRQERQLRQALAHSEERLQLAVSGSNDGLWDWDVRSGGLYFSPRCAAMLGYTAGELPQLRETLLALVHPADFAALPLQLRRHLRGDLPYDAEFRLCTKANSHLWVRARGRLVRTAAGRVLRMAGSLTDITDHKRSEAQIFAEKERAQVTLQAIGDAVITTDVCGQIDSLNPAAERLTGWRSEEAIGMPLHRVCMLKDEVTHAPVSDLVEAALERRWKERPALLLVLRAGSLIAVKPSVALISSRAGNAIGVVLVLHDMSREREHAARLTYEASHDALTGLVNRLEFERRLAAAMARAPGEADSHTLMYLDLDQFKVVNDTCGHAAGDELIRQVASVMRGQLRKGDTLARLGGDEFGVLLEHCPTHAGQRVAEALRRSIAQWRFVHRQRTFSLGVSIGLISLDSGVTQVEEALSAADAACYMAKEGGRNRVQVYRPQDDAVRTRHDEMEWVSRIHAALAAGRFCLYAQEIVPLQPSGAGGRHLELLLRMVDEAGLLVPPMAFIPACERYNLMPMLDRWVIDAGFAALARHQIALPGDVALCGLNLSAASLGDDLLPGYVRQRAAHHGISLEGICFEITETAAIGNLAQAAVFIRQLQEMGCRFALDDFGAGMSSFAYLKHLPAEYLKIDGSFVREMLNDPVNLVMVEAIQRISHAMGKQTIAEYVENEALLARLRELGVDYAQGYGVGPPMPFASVTNTGATPEPVKLPASAGCGNVADMA
ncbi:EAL domain-containing protein [Cupriavidus sp. 8B]